MKNILAAAAAFAALAFSAPAAFAQEDVQTIVVTAPDGLSKKDAERWDRFNKDAAKLERKLAKLYEERRDDLSDVEEAREDLEDAKDKLEDEERDMRRTASEIAETQERLRTIEQQRQLLRRD